MAGTSPPPLDPIANSVLGLLCSPRQLRTACSIGGQMALRSSDPIIFSEGLQKRYGRVDALRGLDLSVPAGSVSALLGPNGAGKTTAVRILATLTAPDAGRATAAGYDVVRDADQVRHCIGLAGQHAAVDERLTARDTLRLFGRLSHLSRRQARLRADELLERFGLAGAADRVVSTYSGGRRRRLDGVASPIVAPRGAFLDEPTSGLGPHRRGEIWDSIRDLVAGGTTRLLPPPHLPEDRSPGHPLAPGDRCRGVPACR